MNTQIIICLGTQIKGNLMRIEQILPSYLSTKFNIICFEYPRFKNLFLYFSGKQKISERINAKLTVFHSIGIFPNARNIALLNHINHSLNFFIFRHLYKVSSDSVLISFTPEAVYCQNLKKVFTKIIYWTIDNYVALPFWKKTAAKNQFLNLEKKYLTLSDLVVAASLTLKSKYESLHPKVIYFPTPFLISPSKSGTKIPPGFKKIKHPIIGFMGEFDDWRIDTGLMIEAIKKLKKFTFVVLGRFSINNKSLSDQFTALPNFNYLGYKKTVEIGDYLKNFDVCLIPYKPNRYGQYAYPVKVNEYLAFGKPVVTTPLPALSDLAGKNLIYWSKSDKEFINNIEIASTENNRKLSESRRKYALKNTWENRFAELLRLIKV